MLKFSNRASGFTLVEVLVSVAVLIIFLPFAASMLTNSQLLASYSKHKIQAAYAAQQIIETARQNPFLSIAAGQSVTIPAPPSPSAYVILDTKGIYTNLNCATNPGIFCGRAVITVTPVVYPNSSGTAPAVDHFVVTINWNENIVNLQVPITETYAADIANDTVLN